jgi:acyl-CoA thioester hydrolase
LPRLKLQPLDSYPFRTDIVVRVTDMNLAGHLGNDRLVSLVHEARVAFLAAHGFTEMDLDGVSLVIADAAIVYQGEAFAGDVLRFEVAGGEPRSHGFRIFYRVTRRSDGAAIALVENGIVCFDYATRKIQPLPSSVKILCRDVEMKARHK